MATADILHWYGLSNEYDRSVGAGWYQAARLECVALSERYGIELERVVYAVAALSPQLKWERNIAAARAVIEGATRFAGVYTANIEKAVHILFDRDDWKRWLSGNKVNSFARNILGSVDDVTVDTWAWRIWTGTENLFEKIGSLDKVYFDIAADYREAARIVGIEARQLQAITWTTIRRLANGKTGAGQLSLDI